LDRNEFKRSESGFDTNKTNSFLSISIHFRLLGVKKKLKILDLLDNFETRKNENAYENKLILKNFHPSQLSPSKFQFFKIKLATYFSSSYLALIEIFFFF